MPRALLQSVVVVAATVAVSAFGSGRVIVTRHDRPDAAFLELAKRFPQTVTVKSAAARGPGDAGTLIDPRWVMTAAHVASSLQAGDVAVIGGENFRIDRIVRHPDWRTNADFRFDIALLELDRAVTAVVPATVYTASDELGRVLTFVGRGGNGTGLTGPTAEDGQLRGATNRVEQADGGLLRFRFDEPGSPGATDLEGISGPGDSGGPAYLVVGESTFVLGVSSAQDSRPTGRQQGRYGVLEFYVRVSEYSAWIRSTLAVSARPTGNTPPPTTPGVHAAVWEREQFRSGDSLLITTHVLAPVGVPRAVVLAFHQGDANARGEYRSIAPRLVDSGYAVVATDLRAGGNMFDARNETVNRIGTSREFCDAEPDVRAAIQWARSRFPDQPLILLGSSFSGSLVLRLARRAAGVAAVAAFSPATGPAVADCLPEASASAIDVPALIVRSAAEAARPAVAVQLETFARHGHTVHVAQPGTHGASALDAQRVDGDIGPTWDALFRLLASAGAQEARWPAGRARHHMVHDPVTQQVMLFGGADRDTSIWAWKDGAWRSLPNALPARFNEAMTYDARRDRFVLHGGSERPDETWEWDRRDWRRVNAAGPGARGHHALLYDSVRRVAVLFGNNDDTPTSDTWGFDGGRWTQLATEGPPARGVFGSAFDAKRGVWVIFGGCCARGIGLLGDTWEWNGRRWSRIWTDSAPPARYDASMAYDPQRGHVVLFGGRNRAAAFADTWEYDGRSWRQLDVVGPSARSGHALVYDPGAKAILLFGGQQGRDYLNDFWKLEAGWSQIQRP